MELDPLCCRGRYSRVRAPPWPLSLALGSYGYVHFLAVLRAFPFVFAFTPYLLTKRGLGVLIPAALYLCGATYERLFGHRAPDAEDNRNFAQGVSIFFLAWGVLALIFFAQQSLAIDRKTEDKGRA